LIYRHQAHLFAPGKLLVQNEPVVFRKSEGFMRYQLHSLIGLATLCSLAASFWGQKPILAQASYFDPPPLNSRYVIPVTPADNGFELSPTPLPHNSNGICPAQLSSTVSQIIDRPLFASARWGIQVEAADSHQVLYSRNPNQFLIPASNMKLFTTAAALKSLYPISSNPNALASRIGVINRYSDNEYSDLLLSQVGGAQQVKSILTPLGVDPQGYRQVDGSGLSRSNVAKAPTIVSLLKAMYVDETRKVFYYSLSLSSVNGTLQNRFRGTPLQSMVRAKTGTLNGVRALSGYMNTPNYGTLIFSVMVNQPGQSGEVLLSAVDRVVLQLGRLTSCL
jgi:serine-type D-Ala-D-Ala carboxypeptidase/endopeptidase (penicillin-binding protein 4)